MKFVKILLFNPITKLFLNPPANNLWGEEPSRVFCAFLELIYHVSIFLPIGIIVFLFSLGIDSTLLNYTYDTIFACAIIVLLNKDFFNGQSVVKKKTGFQVVDFKSRKPASEFKCMIRNTTLPIWLLEAPFFLVDSQRRLGDYIAGTILIKRESTNPEAILIDIQNKKYTPKNLLVIFASIIIAILVIAVLNFI